MATDESVAVPVEPAFVVHHEPANRVLVAGIVVLCGLALAALTVTGIVGGFATTAAASTTGQAAGGLLILFCALGIGGTASWFGWSEREALAGEIRQPGGVALAVTGEGVALGGAPAIPWDDVCEVRI